MLSNDNNNSYPIKIRSLCDLIQLTKSLGMRSDWHEPDEQDVSARVAGSSFDNAGFWPTSDCKNLPPTAVELHVIISHKGVDVAAINLATLLSWASRSANVDTKCTMCSSDTKDKIDNIDEVNYYYDTAKKLFCE